MILMLHTVLFTLLALLLKVSAQDYQVKDFRAISKNQTSIELGWSNPTKVDFTRLKLNYTITEFQYQSNKTFFLSKSSESFVISELIPGSLVRFVLSTLVDDQEKDSVQLSVVTALESVKNVVSVVATRYGVDIKFVPPAGFYSHIIVIAFDESKRTPFTASVPYLVDEAELLLLPSGNRVEYLFQTSKESEEAISQIYDFKMPLDVVVASWKGLNYSSILVEWTQLIGSYSFIEMKLVVLSSDFEENLSDKGYEAYLTNESEQKKCQPGFVQYFNLTYDQANENSTFLLNDLCAMSLFNLTFKVTKEDFEPRETFAILQSTYENFDCQKVQVETVNNKTIFRWQPIRSVVDVVFIQLSRLNGSLVFETNMTRKENQVAVYNLGFVKSYMFSIQVRGNNITSLKCNQIITTGETCPSYNTTVRIKLKTAPYPNNVVIETSPFLFTSPSNIYNYSVLLSEENDCRINNSTNICFKPYSWYLSSYEDSKALETQLSQSVECDPIRKVPCDQYFKYDKNYYVSIEANGPCGFVVSDPLIINIPTQFPLGTTVAITVIGTLVLLTVFFLAIIIMAYKQIKRQNVDESNSNLIAPVEDSSEIYY